SAGECPRVLRRGRPRHAGVPPGSDPAKVGVFTHPEFVQRGCQLTGAVATQLVPLGCPERAQLRRNDLALFTERAGHQSDLGPFGDIASHRATRGDRLIVGMSMYQQQSTALWRQHISESSTPSTVG